MQIRIITRPAIAAMATVLVCAMAPRVVLAQQCRRTCEAGETRDVRGCCVPNAVPKPAAKPERKAAPPPKPPARKQRPVENKREAEAPATKPSEQPVAKPAPPKPSDPPTVTPSETPATPAPGAPPNANKPNEPQPALLRSHPDATSTKPAISDSALTAGTSKPAPVQDETAVPSAPKTPAVIQLAFTRAGVEITAGVSFTDRTLASDAREGIDGPTYEGPLAPALFLGVELYPASFASESLPARFILANIGIQAEFERVFALRSEIAYSLDGDDMTETVNTTQMRFGAGIVYRLFFGDSATAPVLKFGVGYERFQFSLDRGGLPDNVIVPLPDVAYASLAPSLTFRVPVTAALAMTAGGRLLVLLDPGDVAKADQYGDTSSSLGYEAGLDVEYMIGGRLGVRVGARYMNVTLGFEGNGELSNNLDDDPATQDVDGFTDTYLGGLVTVGYLF